MVARPEDYHFSSYLGYVRAPRARPCVTYRRVLDKSARRSDVARRAYGKFVPRAHVPGIAPRVPGFLAAVWEVGKMYGMAADPVAFRWTQLYPDAWLIRFWHFVRGVRGADGEGRPP